LYRALTINKQLQSLDVSFCVLNGNEPRPVQRLLSTLSSSGGIEARGEDEHDGQLATEAGGICQQLLAPRKRGAGKKQHRLQERGMKKSKAPIGSGFMPGGLHVPQNDSDEQHSKQNFDPVGSKSDLRKYQDEIWHAQFLLLRSFQQASGYADIKKLQDKQLVRWMLYQKSRYKNGKLPKDRQKMLEDVGINLQETSFLHSAKDTSPNALSNRSNVDSKTVKKDAREAREKDTGTGNEKDVRRAGILEKVQNGIYNGVSPQYETGKRKQRDLRFCVLNGHEPQFLF